MYEIEKVGYFMKEEVERMGREEMMKEVEGVMRVEGEEMKVEEM